MKTSSITDNMKWLPAIEAAKAGKAIKCPKCSSVEAKVDLYAGEDLVGYIKAKCDACGSEVWISRALFKPTDHYIKV